MGKSLRADDVIKRLRDAGWEEITPRKAGSHRHFKHATREGKVTVPFHKGKELLPATLRSIEKQSGVSMR